MTVYGKYEKKNEGKSFEKIKNSIHSIENFIIPSMKIRKGMIHISWLTLPEEQDYPAAQSYLSLLFDKETTDQYVGDLRKIKIARFKAKDIFRASKLSLLGVSNSHVKKDRKKIESGKDLSPLLLVRDPKSSTIIIADGYHRLCAVYSFDEDAIIPCKIVG